MKTLGCSTNGDQALENNDSECEGYEGDSDTNKIYNNSDEEGEYYVRQCDYCIKHVELRFSNV